jgi:hypothetical protein
MVPASPSISSSTATVTCTSASAQPAAARTTSRSSSCSRPWSRNEGSSRRPRGWPAGRWARSDQPARARATRRMK